MHNELAQKLNLPVEWVDSVVADAPALEETSETLLELIDKMISKVQISEFGVESKPSVYELKLAVAGFVSGNFQGYMETREQIEVLYEVLKSRESNKNLK
jgi:hypothetical protein